MFVARSHLMNSTVAIQHQMKAFQKFLITVYMFSDLRSTRIAPKTMCISRLLRDHQLIECFGGATLRQELQGHQFHRAACANWCQPYRECSPVTSGVGFSRAGACAEWLPEGLLIKRIDLEAQIPPWISTKTIIRTIRAKGINWLMTEQGLVPGSIVHPTVFYHIESTAVLIRIGKKQTLSKPCRSARRSVSRGPKGSTRIVHRLSEYFSGFFQGMWT